jgi:secreted trypsin-like serine protease
MRFRAAIRGTVALAALTAVAAVAAGTAPAATPASSADRVIAGSPADPAQWPFAAALMVRDRNGEVLDCTGSVIAPRYVVTAAHCAIGMNPRKFSVIVGRATLKDTGSGSEIRVKRAKVNPRYGPPDYRADIAILTLAHRTTVTPAELPTVAQDDALTKPGASLHVAGWGATRSNGSNTSNRLLTTEEVALKGDPCKRTYGRSFAQETTICTQGAKLSPPAHGHAGACYGDSGGPLVAEGPHGPLLVGAVSGGGLRCGTSPDYYARVAANLKFIKRVTGVTPQGP